MLSLILLGFGSSNSKNGALRTTILLFSNGSSTIDGLHGYGTGLPRMQIQITSKPGLKLLPSREVAMLLHILQSIWAKLCVRKLRIADLNEIDQMAGDVTGGSSDLGISLVQGVESFHLEVMKREQLLNESCQGGVVFQEILHLTSVSLQEGRALHWRNSETMELTFAKWDPVNGTVRVKEDMPLDFEHLPAKAQIWFNGNEPTT